MTPNLLESLIAASRWKVIIHKIYKIQIQVILLLNCIFSSQTAEEKKKKEESVLCSDDLELGHYRSSCGKCPYDDKAPRFKGPSWCNPEHSDCKWDELGKIEIEATTAIVHEI